MTSAWQHCSLLRMKRAVLVTLLITAFMPIEAAHAASISVAWDPSPAPEVIGYRVYVGTQPGIYTRAYDVGDRTSFTYEDEESRYYFAIAAYAYGPRVGPLSEEVSGYAATFNKLVSPFVAPRVVGYTSGLVSSLAALPDGRVLSIEDGRRVRVVADNTILPDPAFTLNDPLLRLDQIVIDPDFATTRIVYVSQTETLRDGRRELRIARYREVQNQLGEPAVIIAGLALPSSGNAVFTVDARGHIYVALPSTSTSSGRGVDAYQGLVLRFTTDGTVPSGSRAHSPILARGYEVPTALEWNPTRDELLLAGHDAGAPHSLARLGLQGSETAEWPRLPIRLREASGQLPSSGASGGIALMALRPGGTAEAADLLLLRPGTRLDGAMIEGPSVRPLWSHTLERYGEARALDVGRDDALYVAFDTGTGSGTRQSVVVRFAVP